MTHDFALPHHVPEQIALYQTDHLLTQEVCLFDPADAASRLQEQRQVLAVDIGGDKIRRATYTIDNGSLTKLDEQTLRSKQGAGYLAFLEQLSEEAVARDLVVGISCATKMDGSVITRTVNLPVFLEEFRLRYGADYENLFPGRSFVANDTITGICGASTLLSLQGANVRDVAFFICASGMGASVIAHGTAMHVEAGHVPLVDALNPLGQVTACGVEGRTYVCVERVTAARAGIEDLYRRRTGETLDGVALGRMYETGNPLATSLYETSALALAHAIAGVAERYGFSNSDQGTVVLHGGNFEVARYRKAIIQCVADMPRLRIRTVFSRDLSANICLDGAAILAATRLERS